MKFMNLKRFGATIMAGVLTLSMAVPAFAADTPAGQVVISGSYEDIPISVSVPTTGTAQINPYGLPVEFALSDTITKVSVSGEQITSVPLSIRNQGATKLSVNATLAVDTSGTDNGVSVKKIGLTAAQKGKEINLALQVAGLNDNKYAVSSLDTDLEDNIIKAFADNATWASAKSLNAEDTNAGTALADATVAKSASALAVLGAATVEAGGLVTYSKDSIAVFRLTGKLNESPVKSVSGDDVDDPWTAADKFSATVVFKFKPAKGASVTLDKAKLELGLTGNNTGSVTANFAAGDTDLTVKSYAWTSDSTTVLNNLTNATTATVGVSAKAAGTATLTCLVTLSDDSTVTVTCPVVADAAFN